MWYQEGQRLGNGMAEIKGGRNWDGGQWVQLVEKKADRNVQSVHYRSKAGRRGQWYLLTCRDSWFTHELSRSIIWFYHLPIWLLFSFPIRWHTNPTGNISSQALPPIASAIIHLPSTASQSTFPRPAHPTCPAFNPQAAPPCNPYPLPGPATIPHRFLLGPPPYILPAASPARWPTHPWGAPRGDIGGEDGPQTWQGYIGSWSCNANGHNREVR